MKAIIWKKDRIDYLVSGLCKYYNISPHELFKRHKKKELTARKGIAIKLLKDVADCTYEDLCKITKSSGVSSLVTHYTAISDNLSPDSYGNKELKKSYLEILDYLEL